MLTASHDRYKHIYHAAAQALTTYGICTFIDYIYPGHPASANSYGVCRTIDLVLSRHYGLKHGIVLEGPFGLQESHQATYKNA
jgi:hypothetical protein